MVHINVDRVLWVDEVQEDDEDEISYYIMFDNGRTLDTTKEEGKRLIDLLDGKNKIR